MILVSVCGAHSGVGKTTLASILLKRLEGFSAIKVTRTKLFSSIITDKELIRKSGKDSAVLKESGAETVVWVKSSYRDMKETIPKALGIIRDYRGVIIEGNSPIEFCSPSLIIFVIDEMVNDIKKSGLKALKKADIVVLNSNTTERAMEIKEKIKRLNDSAEIFTINLQTKTGEVDMMLLSVMSRLGVKV
ncbi:MAG: hypothetical protein AB1488_01285 [Nitrospirota bacterium]